MKYILSLIAVTTWLALTSGCVSVHRDAPATTRTTTVNAPLVPPVSASTTTTTY